MGLGLALFMVGARRIPSAQAALINTLESPLAPFWVWLSFAEVPPTTTFIGGALILAALGWHFAGELREQES
jgi:drug/metabolite transporter (DMT)-like permease